MQVAQVQRGCHAGRGQSGVQQGVLPGLSYCQAADGNAPAHRLCSKQLPIVERLRHCTRHVILIYLQAAPVGEHCSYGVQAMKSLGLDRPPSWEGLHSRMATQLLLMG